MALPDLIEIIPLAQPVRAEITVPGSKSITNRALILAALADGEVTLTGALWSEDTQVMVEALRTLGFDVRVELDLAEFCNRTITVKGQGGRIPKAGTVEKPLELFVGNAGTAARFLAAMVCLGNGVYSLSGVSRMHERPQAALFSALRELGYRVEPENGNDKLPVRIYGTGPKKGKCRVSIEASSQFASALLLSSRIGGWEIEIFGENAEESPYVAMTSKLMEEFPHQGGTFQIEGDASSGSYFWAASWLQGEFPRISPTKVVVTNWPDSKSEWKARWETASPELQKRFEMGELSITTFKHLQIDTGFTHYLRFPEHRPTISRRDDLGDSIMTAIVITPFAHHAFQFTDLGRLRVQECERVVALRTELTKCGAKVIEEDDTLTVHPASSGELHGAEIETYHDHRMAMCFAILGLKVPGIRLKNPSCVKKTFPNFFQKLAAAPPNGLGVEIWEVKEGKRTRKLEGEDLFAD